MSKDGPVFERLRTRNEWKFFAALPKAAGPLAVAWWVVLVLRGVLPAVFAIAMGVLVAAVQRGDRLVDGLALVGIVFVLLQVLTPIHQAVGANLGDRTAAWLYDRLTEACVRPPGLGHLEDPKLTNDLTVARDFDLGMTGPPLFISMDFIACGLVEMIGDRAAADDQIVAGSQSLKCLVHTAEVHANSSSVTSPVVPIVMESFLGPAFRAYSLPPSDSLLICSATNP